MLRLPYLEHLGPVKVHIIQRGMVHSHGSDLLVAVQCCVALKVRKKSRYVILVWTISGGIITL